MEVVTELGREDPNVHIYFMYDFGGLLWKQTMVEEKLRCYEFVWMGNGELATTNGISYDGGGGRRMGKITDTTKFELLLLHM